MTGIMFVLTIISIILTFICDYLRRICRCLEDKENSDKEKGGAK